MRPDLTSDLRKLPSQGCRKPGSRLWCVLYGQLNSETVRAPLRRWLTRWEGGPLLACTIRDILRNYYGVTIGLFSLWDWRGKPSRFHRGTRIGRYCYVADSVRTFTRNHPFYLRSSHGLFYNPALGVVRTASLEFGRVEIGDGVWVGHQAIVLPPTRQIGEGTVILPGAVVCTDLPAYAVVGGFPARVLRWRFDAEMRTRLQSLRWPAWSPVELASQAPGSNG